VYISGERAVSISGRKRAEHIEKMNGECRCFFEYGESSIDYTQYMYKIGTQHIAALSIYPFQLGLNKMAIDAAAMTAPAAAPCKMAVVKSTLRIEMGRSLTMSSATMAALLRHSPSLASIF
jgi:hypothetical protein